MKSGAPGPEPGSEEILLDTKRFTVVRMAEPCTDG